MYVCMYVRIVYYSYLFACFLQTGVFPSLAPFAHALAAVITAALTGSILFITSFPKGIIYWFHYVFPRCVLNNRFELVPY